MPASKGLPKLILVLGYSGSGRSVARRILEDIGYDVIENLPHTFMYQFKKILSKSTHDERVALIISTNIKDVEEIYIAIEKIKASKSIDSDIIFLECNKNELIRRYQELRRPHPNSKSGNVSEGVENEQKAYIALKSLADLVIDTSNLAPNELKNFIDKRYSEINNSSLVVNFTSFGFKHGTPLDVDFLFDVRFLPNPFYDEKLRFLTGIDKEVYNYVINTEQTQQYLSKIINILDYALEGYRNIQKYNISIGVSCTGGQHRSVSIVEYLARHYKEKYSVYVWHRDINKRVKR